MIKMLLHWKIGKVQKNIAGSRHTIASSLLDFRQHSESILYQRILPATFGTNHSKGFTIVEMLICIGIIAILSTVAVPAFNIWMTKTRLKVAARDVYSVLQYGRSSAVKRNTDIAVLFDTANESYMIYEDNGAGGGTAGDGTQNGTEATLKTGSLEKGVDMYQTTFNVKANQSYFNNRGLAENGWGYVYLKTSNDEYKRVMVSTTGMIKIESSSDGSTWS